MKVFVIDFLYAVDVVNMLCCDLACTCWNLLVFAILYLFVDGCLEEIDIANLLLR